MSNTFSKIGDVITWKVPVINNGPNNEPLVKVEDIIPSGLRFVKATANKGTILPYNTSQRKLTWNLKLNVGEEAELVITTVVQDITKAVEIDPEDDESPVGFINEVTISGNNTDDITINNAYTQTVTLSLCPPAAAATSKSLCPCGDALSGDTLCTSGGDSRAILVDDSLKNLDESFALTDYRYYNIYPYIIDPTKDVEFSYVIHCKYGDSWVQTAGPAKITIPAIIPEDFTDELIIGEDGMAVHSAVNGSVVTFQTGLTTVTVNNSNKTITFTYPNGSSVVANLATWFSGLSAVTGNFRLENHKLVYDLIDPSDNSIITEGIATNIVVRPYFTINSSIISADITLNNPVKNFNLIDDSGSANVEVTLPDPSTITIPTGQTDEWTFKRMGDFDGGSITLKVSNAKTIDGSVTYVFPDTDLTSITLWTDGVNYWIK